ncbi:hypothetical protein Hte_012342 [Hypoxylon texense]
MEQSLEQQQPPHGAKRKRDDDDDADNYGHVAKRYVQLTDAATLELPSATVTTLTAPSHRSMVNRKMSSCSCQGPDSSCGCEDVDCSCSCCSLSRQVAKLSISPPPLFPKFPQLPPELRLQIWRETWEPREVGMRRTLMGIRDTATGDDDISITNFATERDRVIRLKHVNIAKHHWGVPPYSEDKSDEFMHMDHQYRTVTVASVPPPVTHRVNRESRYETLLHYQFSWALTRGIVTSQTGQTNIIFNFNLDRLMYPLHCPLSTSFWMADLRRLQRLTIPELTPVLPDFYSQYGPWSDDEIPFPDTFDHKEMVFHPEFELVWHLLRKFFPALREIRLEPFTSCDRYYPTSNCALPEPINLETGSEGLAEADDICHACFNIQTAIDAAFPVIGVDPNRSWVEVPDFDQVQSDTDRILDSRGIMEPVYKDETIVIGLAPPEREGWEPEKVTVTFKSIYNTDTSYRGIVNLRDRAINWGHVKRTIVARTLERALGPPGTYDYMTYKIGEEPDDE